MCVSGLGKRPIEPLMPNAKTPTLTRVEAETIQGQGQKLQHREIQKKWRQSRDGQGLEVEDAGDAVWDARVCLS